MTVDSGANADQIAYWNNSAGATWAALQDRLDRQIEPLGQRAMDAGAPKAGEQVLDIGCGCGQTSLELAQRVGPTGQVLGVDISEPMLEVARRRGGEAGMANVSFLAADAQTQAFPPGGFDLAFSRFGVMFFDDPTAAFRNIAAALRQDGRLAFVCWRPLAENPWMGAPMQAALSLLPPMPPPADPTAPGPFAFADPERLRGILAAAGLVEIDIAPHDQMIGGNDLDETVAMSLRVGPLGAVLRENPELKDDVVGAIREALARHVTPQGVMLASATWIVTAKRP